MTDAERKVRREAAKARKATEARDAAICEIRAKARKATEARDAAICEMRDAGATLRAIAEAAGITHAGVARVLKRSSPHPPEAPCPCGRSHRKDGGPK